jgi:hypothetical protein
MTKSDIKIKKAIEATEKYIKEAEARGAKETFDMGNDVGFTILWCEKNNLRKYREMLEYKDKRQLPDYLRELFRAI